MEERMNPLMLQFNFTTYVRTEFDAKAINIIENKI